MMSFGMIGGGLLFILLVVAMVAGGGWLINSLAGKSSGGTSAREILDQRYARGEISREDYERMKLDLA